MAWAAGDTGKTTRNILQRKLLGPVSALGTGIIPGHLLKRTTPKAGVADAIELVEVEHMPTGGRSLLELKSFDQKREGFQGTEQDVILLDEEPPEDVYDECVLRTLETPERPGGGIVMLTYTPLKGLTQLTLRFLPEYAPEAEEQEQEQADASA
jgi:phage terminase large subunit-like protein